MKNKGIISILCVEDGSIDIQNLEENGLQDGKVLVYRQGSRPPFILQLPRNNQQLKSQQTQLAVDKLEEIKDFCTIRSMTEDETVAFSILYKINSMINELKGE